LSVPERDRNECLIADVSEFEVLRSVAVLGLVHAVCELAMQKWFRKVGGVNAEGTMMKLDANGRSTDGGRGTGMHNGLVARLGPKVGIGGAAVTLKAVKA
jgi:hypothetical protein